MSVIQRGGAPVWGRDINALCVGRLLGVQAIVNSMRVRRDRDKRRYERDIHGMGKIKCVVREGGGWRGEGRGGEHC